MDPMFERRDYLSPTLTSHGPATRETRGVGYGRTEESGWQSGQAPAAPRPE